MVVGLGNPGLEYRNTRHNAGFMLVDAIAAKAGASWRLEKKFFAELSECSLGEVKCLLVKPQTFMNLSGKAVAAVAAYRRVELGKILVALDDADLPLGAIRLRPGGGAGGHHGLESVIEHLAGKEFPRLRLGIARPVGEVRDIANHVLGRFDGTERNLLETVLQQSVRQVECWAAEGIASAMNCFNGLVTPPKSV